MLVPEKEWRWHEVEKADKGPSKQRLRALTLGWSFQWASFIKEGKAKFEGC